MKNLKKTHCGPLTKKVRRKKKYNTLDTNRDRKLFMYLFRVKGANIEQINRDIFKTSYGATVSRLRLLRIAGFLERRFYSETGISHPKAVYFVTRKGMYAIGYDDVDLKAMELRSNHPSHEIGLGQIRHKFLQLEGCRGYATENELQTQILSGVEDYDFDAFITLRSDAFMHLQIGENQYRGAVEYEQSAKTKVRYQLLFQDYYYSNSVDFVIYVTKGKPLKRLIMKSDRELRGERNSKIFCTTMKELLEAENHVVVTNSHDRYLKLRLK